MFCNEFIEKISPYIDGYLDEEEKEKIEKHLRECENCGKLYEDIMMVKIFSPSLKNKFTPTSLKRKRRKILKGAFAFLLLILTIFTLLFEYNIISRKEKTPFFVENVKKEKIIKPEKKIIEPVKIYYTDMIYEVSYEEIVP